MRHVSQERGEMLLSTTQHPVIAALFAVHNWGELRMREKSESVTAMGQRAGGRKTWYRQGDGDGKEPLPCFYLGRGSADEDSVLGFAPCLCWTVIQ
jgi:hypothetical protein